jgi:hypothetical protein
MIRLSTVVLLTLVISSSAAIADNVSPPQSDFPGIVRIQAPDTKGRLASVIEDLRSGSPNMSQFEPMLRIAIQQQKPKLDAYLASVGKVTDISFVGAQNGGDVYKVTFERGVSAWWIQLAANGNIAGLYFQ